MTVRTTKPAGEALVGEVLILPNGSGRVIQSLVRDGTIVYLNFLNGTTLHKFTFVTGVYDPVTVESQ